MTASAAAPYLSIVLTGRNDNFGGNFNERLLRALVFNHEQLLAHGISHEFVLVEWAPLAGKPFLATVVEDACHGLIASGQLVSFVVDPKYHDAFSMNPRLAFQEFIAKNVGIRHSRGDFILTTNTDIYLGRALLATLAQRTLAPRVLYRTVRIDLHDGLPLDRIDWNVLEDERNVEVVNAITPPWFTNASGDFLLLDRPTYLELRGFNEVYRVAKIHIDSNFCVKAHASGVPLVDMGAPVYHLGAGTLYSQHPQFAARPDLAPWGNIRWNSRVIYDNPPNWGLAAAPPRQASPGIHYLEFDWGAVPPLLDLQRIVLPGTAAAQHE